MLEKSCPKVPFFWLVWVPPTFLEEEEGTNKINFWGQCSSFSPG